MAESSTRWWEFYAVRYAMGTAVGSVAIVFLSTQRPEIQSLLPGNAFHGSQLNSSSLLLAAVYGLIYCYVASGPILVFHAGRFLLNPDASKQTLARRFVGFSVVPFSCSVGAYFAAGRHGVEDKPLFCMTAYALALLLELEAVAVYLCLARSLELFRFYERLDGRRQFASKGNREIVDSYRHLREHGNSFFIVFLEVGLAVVLFQSQKIVPLKEEWCLKFVWLTVLTAWILPSVFVWLISTFLERRFADS